MALSVVSVTLSAWPFSRFDSAKDCSSMQLQEHIAETAVERPRIGQRAQKIGLHQQRSRVADTKQGN